MRKGGDRKFTKPKIGNDSLHRDSNNNGAGTVNFATSKDMFVNNTTFLHRNIHKYTWTSPDGKTHNHIDHIFIGRRWHSSISHVRFLWTNCHWK